jgi:hypothetical protein
MVQSTPKTQLEATPQFVFKTLPKPQQKWTTYKAC